MTRGNNMARIYNFEKHNWDDVRNIITDEKHLNAYNSILVEFKELYAISRTGKCDDMAVYNRLDQLQEFLDSYRKYYKNKTP